MKTNIRSLLLSNLLPLLVFALVAFLLIVRFIDPEIILGGGENSLFLDENARSKALSTWIASEDFGYSSITQNCDLLMFTVIVPFLRIFSGIMHPSVSFLFLSSFLSSYFCFLFLRSYLEKCSPLLCIPGSLLFAYNAFRLISPLNPRLAVFFVLLPLFMWLITKFTRRYSHSLLVFITSLTVFTSPLGGNLPLFVVLYLLITLYYLYCVFAWVRPGQRRKYLWGFVFFILFSILLNGFWLLPLLRSLLNIYNMTEGAENVFSATGAGAFYDHFRFLGSWGWRLGHLYQDYYPFHTHYYNVPLLVATFSLVPIYLYPFINRGKYTKEARFFILVFLVFFTLLAGGKGPFGLIYNSLYRYFPPFRLFREPFTKFTPAYVLFGSFGLTLFLCRVQEKLPHKGVLLKLLLAMVSSGLVLLSVFPLFGEAVPVKRWNGGPWGVVVKIPEYWVEFSEYVRSSLSDEQSVLVFAYTPYATQNNWEYGVNVIGNIARYLVSAPIVAPSVVSNSLNGSGHVLTDMMALSKHRNFEYYLGYLGITHILQENDLEWRYSEKIYAPSSVDTLLSALDIGQIGQWGIFDENEISKLLNDEKDIYLHEELGKGLLGKAALKLYKLPEKYYSPKIFAASENWFIGADMTSFIDVISDDPAHTDVAYHFSSQEFYYDGPYDNVIVVYEPETSPNAHVGIDLSTFVQPQASISPSSPFYILTKLKERSTLLRKKKDRNQYVQTLAWHGLKRFVEVDKYTSLASDQRDSLLNAGINSLDMGLDLLFEYRSNFQKKTYRELLQFYGNSIMSVWLLTDRIELPEAHVGSIETLYRRYLILYKEGIWVEQPPTFQVPISGEYSVSLADSTKEYLNLEDAYSIFQFEHSEESCIVYLGSSDSPCFFDKDLEYNALLSGLSTPNLVEKLVDDAAHPFSPDLTGSIMRFYPVVEQQEYVIRFNYNVALQSDLEMIIKESRKNEQGLGLHYQTIGRKKIPNYSFINELPIEFRSEMCVDGIVSPCFVSYEYAFVPSLEATEVFIQFSMLPSSIDLVMQDSQQIRDVAVNIAHTPKILLRHNSAQPASLSTKLTYTKINPTHYKVRVSGAEFPLSIVFNTAYSPGWELHYAGDIVGDDLAEHYVVNGFANYWTVSEKIAGGSSSFELDLIYRGQRMYNLMLLLSAVSTSSLILIGLVLLFIKRYQK